MGLLYNLLELSPTVCTLHRDIQLKACHSTLCLCVSFTLYQSTQGSAGNQIVGGILM